MLAVAALVPWLLWLLGRAFGLERGTPLVQLMAFTPYVAAAAILPVGLALLLRRPWVAVAAAAVFLALIGLIAPRAFGSGSSAPAGLTVMSANLLVGGADAKTIVDLVRSHNVDVLALQEYTPDSEAALAAAGVDTVLPFSFRHPVPGTQGSALYSRFRLTDAGSARNGGGFYQAYGQVLIPDAPPVFVVSTHPLPPSGFDEVPLWRDDLRAEPPAEPSGRRLILAGDFNATLDHAELRRLIATGYRDAASEVGAGLVPTWPYAGRRSVVTPKVTIDHILVDARLGVRDFRAYTIPNSDHRAVIASLAFLPQLGG